MTLFLAGYAGCHHPAILPASQRELIHLRFNAEHAAAPGGLKKGVFMPTTKPHVKAYLSTEEYALVAAMASQAGLSISNFVRQVCLA